VLLSNDRGKIARNLANLTSRVNKAVDAFANRPCYRIDDEVRHPTEILKEFMYSFLAAQVFTKKTCEQTILKRGSNMSLSSWSSALIDYALRQQKDVYRQQEEKTEKTAFTLASEPAKKQEENTSYNDERPTNPRGAYRAGYKKTYPRSMGGSNLQTNYGDRKDFYQRYPNPSHPSPGMYPRGPQRGRGSLRGAPNNSRGYPRPPPPWATPCKS
jgi:hypothetical protein